MAAQCSALANSRCYALHYTKSRQGPTQSFCACKRTRACHTRVQLADQPAQHIPAARHKAGLGSCSGYHRRCAGATRATLQGTLVAEPRNDGGARQLITWISELPWTRVAVWVTVAITALQFQDFFGVIVSCCLCCILPRPCALQPAHAIPCCCLMLC